MRSIILLTFVLIIFASCDPVAQMEANIENLTPKSLSIVFESSDSSLNKTLEIPPNQTIRFQEGFDIGSSYLEPHLLDYDSIFITNETNEILRVYKKNEQNKNIYNIDDYWISSEPSKRFFKYTYKIELEDIE